MSGGRRGRKRVAASTGGLSIPHEEHLGSPSNGALLSPAKKVSDASELRSWLSSRMEALVSTAEQTHSGFVKELDAAAARSKKRLKLELEASSRQLEEVNRTWKTFSSDFEEDIQEIQGTRNAFVTKSSSKASSFAEVLKSAENQLESLRAKYAAARA